MAINNQVAVIGDARLSHQTAITRARSVGKCIAQNGYHLVCGGLGGTMQESCHGFKSVPEAGHTIGILPSYESHSANPFIDIIIPTGLDVGRNQLVVASGFAVVVLGGGAGTLSEIALASQIGRPILLLQGSGGWADRLQAGYLDQRQTAPLILINTLEELASQLSFWAKKQDNAATIQATPQR
ncbi:MAG: TIGR00725 family protein [Gammaproteobacteria bacterium]|nr:TIGR00725 family protein [Gammaproteobacteria bacterium]